MNPPETKKDIVVDKIFNQEIQDPFRWLEDIKEPEVKDWIAKQNNFLFKSLEGKEKEIIQAELIENHSIIASSNPVIAQGRYFYEERQPNEDQSVLYMKIGLEGAPVKLFDPNNQKTGNTLTIDYWSPSRSGKYVAYGLSEGGSEMATLYIKNTDTNENLQESIPYCRYALPRWTPDDSGFFYKRNPLPGTVPKGEEHLHTKVYFHKLGDDSGNDELIFGAGRPKDDMIGMSLSPDGRYLSIQVSQKWTENDVYVYDRDTKTTKLIVMGVPAVFSGSFSRDKIFLYTNYKANNYRILWTTYDDFNKPVDEWAEFIPEREFLLQSFQITKSKILVQYLVNACSEVVIFDYDGKKIGEIPLPKYSSLLGISGNRDEEEFFYGVGSFLFPKIIYRYNPENFEYVEYKKIDNPINPNDYEVKQEWFVSKDSTRVPMFIFHKKNIEMNGLNPTILYGYGGFGNSETPGFLRNFVPWLKRGGIFAVANIRGGGEFGERWHKGGIKDKKQSTFDDFIAAAEYLTEKKYTDPKHLGILGGSNGGLLVSAVLVQRPDLFGAVCSKVPLTDMVRFPLFGMAMRWVHEYGDPKIKEDFENILKWSPYHNVQVGTEYPPTLFTTAMNDTRVDPLHSRKMAALLQSVNKRNEVLIFTDENAGHGAGRPISKIVESQAIIITFFAKKLNLKV